MDEELSPWEVVSIWKDMIVDYSIDGICDIQYIILDAQFLFDIVNEYNCFFWQTTFYAVSNAF